MRDSDGAYILGYILAFIASMMCGNGILLSLLFGLLSWIYFIGFLIILLFDSGYLN